MPTVAAPQAKYLTRLPPLPIYRFSVDQYHRLVDVGVLSSEDPVELLDGLIVIKGHSTLAPAISVLDPLTGARDAWSPLPVRRFTVAEYRHMTQMGILSAEDRVELLEGWLVRKMSRSPLHDAVIALLLGIIWPSLPKGWHCRGQSAVVTDLGTPEPDIAIVRGEIRAYRAHHPRSRDVAVAIEVSDSSLQHDRVLKGALYARVGIPVYWIVNIPETKIEVYTDPTGPDPEPAYRQRQDFEMGMEVPLAMEGQEIARIAVRDLLG